MSEWQVIKRNGVQVDFEEIKITEAMMKAYMEVYGNDWNKEPKALTKEVVEDIETYMNLNETNIIGVETIQDMVEKVLLFHNGDVAKAFIIYRYKRALARDNYKELMDSVKEKIMASDVQNQNANVDEKSFGGRVGETSDLILKRYALDYCMSPMSKNNHLNNRIYIHDLSAYAVGNHNCLSVPFDDLLAKGFNTRQVDIRPAKSINTAFQLVAVIFQIQSLQQFGGVSATHLDWTMIPYVRYSLFKHYIIEYVKELEEFDLMDIEKMNDEELDLWVDQKKNEYLKKWNLNEKDFYIGSIKLNKHLYKRALFETKKEIYQAVEGMYHNLNSLQSRSGNQLPFSSINYGTCTLQEGRLITKALLDVCLSGVGKFHRTSIFPCGIFQIMNGVNKRPGDPNYDLFRLALKCTAKRIYPNYANVDWSGNAGYDKDDPKTYFSTMGCRTANGWDINGFRQLKDGRGNICPVTIILPTLAMEANGEIGNKDIDDFFDILEKAIEDAKDMLIERFDWICSQSPDSAKFMYENGTMAGYISEEGIRSALKHGTLAMGQLGLAETLQILIGTNQLTSRGMDLAKRIEQLFKTKCALYKESYKLNFGVYYTPAENLCYTAMSKFKNKYGVIKNISENDYFTNSIHVPVWEKITPFEKIDIEAQLTGYSSAGCITYVELPSTAKNNIDALENIVIYAMDNDIPYFAINTPNDTCIDCGYQDEINDKCPQCGSENIERLRRVTGYITGNYKTAFNKGKQQETEMRSKHIK